MHVHILLNGARVKCCCNADPVAVPCRTRVSANSSNGKTSFLANQLRKQRPHTVNQVIVSLSSPHRMLMRSFQSLQSLPLLLVDLVYLQMLLKIVSNLEALLLWMLTRHSST